MIQIEKLHVEEFRGSRSIDLELKSKSYVVYGPNGSGKSGVVDAIEFALTGSIGRLSGEGTAGISIARHAPHVHRRDDPAAAKVTLIVRDLVSGNSAAVTRTVKDSANFALSPDTPAMRQALQDAMGHPELTLSRRELIKYVVARPGDRAAEVQALLRLDKIEALRRALKATSSKATAESKRADEERKLAEQSFWQHLGLRTLLSNEVLWEINFRRSTLGLAPLEQFTPETDIMHGVVVRTSVPFNLESGRRDVATLRGAIENDNEIRMACGALADKLALFVESPAIMDAIRHRALLDAGLAAVEGPTCPLCEVSWESRETLEVHLRQRLAATEIADRTRKDVLDAAAKYRAQVRTLREQAEQALGAARAYGDDELPHQLKAWIGTLALIEGGMSTFDAITAVDSWRSNSAHAAPGRLVTGLAQLADALDAMPDESAAEVARTFLDVAKDRWARVRIARAIAAQAAVVQAAAEDIYVSFCEAVDAALAALYKTVQNDFSRYYQFVLTTKAPFEPSLCRSPAVWNSPLTSTTSGCFHLSPTIARDIRTVWGFASTSPWSNSSLARTSGTQCLTTS